MLQSSGCQFSSGVEQQFCKLPVVGSNPTIGSIFNKKQCVFPSIDPKNDGRNLPVEGDRRGDRNVLRHERQCAEEENDGNDSHSPILLRGRSADE